MGRQAVRLIVGCGYLGRRVAARWRDQGARVFATTRSPQKAEEFARLGLEPIVCDVLDGESLQHLPQVDVVLYCIGHDRSSGRPMRETYVQGLENVLGALPPLGRLIYVSSTSVYGQCQGEEVDETAKTEPIDESGRVVLEAEQVLRRMNPSAIILRFAGIYGPGRLLRRETIERGYPIVGDPERWLNLIHVEDGVAAVLAAQKQGRLGGTYNIADDQPVRRREFYTALAQLIRASLPRFVLPSASLPPSNHERTNRRIVNRRMREELGVRLWYPTCETGLFESVKCQKEEGCEAEGGR
jgi:nucleoside-diphosphate-sugar epimerase